MIGTILGIIGWVIVAYLVVMGIGFLLVVVGSILGVGFGPLFEREDKNLGTDRELTPQEMESLEEIHRDLYRF